MDDEFKLCWKNFQDNIASGFQNLYDRGDLVDVTLACDGKLLHAHKIVLAICSPYFQEIFITNPCKHPIIILKDVTFNIMCELLEFMYQGVVNVKHTELQSFMKIGQLLQIKGLATNSSSSAASTSSEKSSSQTQNPEEMTNACKDTTTSNSNNVKTNANEPNNAESSSSGKISNTTTSSAAVAKPHSPASSPSPMGFSSPITQQSFKSSSDNNVSLQHSYHTSAKRHADFSSDALSIYSRKQYKRSMPPTEQSSEINDSADTAMDQVNAEDLFLQSIPHISMVESRYDIPNVKREGDYHGSPLASSTASLRNSFGPAFGFDYNLYKNNPGSISEYPNDLHMASDYSKNFGNHMDIPPNSSNVVMLSSTSLLHGNCVFNRNNTVATQQGMKTYWLCKSYRISMCRARCITHQGRVISATGMHNHPPHMRGGNGTATPSSGSYSADTAAGQVTSMSGGSNVSAANIPATIVANNNSNNISSNVMSSNLRLSQASSGGGSMFQHSLHCGPHQQQPQQPHHHQQQHSQNISPPPMPPSQLHHLQQSLPNLLVQHHQHHTSMPSNSQTHTHQHSMVSGPNSVIQNMMHSSANIMHLPNMTLSNQQGLQSPHLSGEPHQQNVVSGTLEITPLMESSPAHMQSPSQRNSNHSHHIGNSIDSPLPAAGSSGGSLQSPSNTHHNISADTCSLSDQQHILVQNTAISSPEMNTNVSAATEHGSQSPIAQSDEIRHRAHVIDSITISPGTSHNFKIEDM